MKSSNAPRIRRQTKCAIYTRTSTDERLSQEFNSLDAQAEACRSYIESQRLEGWVETGRTYDDGGFSGGSIERPGLKQLLEDVAAGRVDVIVVYKIDRLTRSLTDFAKIIAMLDEADASFVSVTQSFNTSTSLGRLTLNILLSFAQFERELTSERIRDKIAASKAKGIFMGGSVPLGYDVLARRLVINEADAAIVRNIFRTYLRVGSVSGTADALNAQGLRTKVQPGRDGNARGGIPFHPPMLRYILANRTYVGETKHKGKFFSGEHDAIIDRGVFDSVQAQLKANAHRRALGGYAISPSLLTGLVWDGLGRPMTSSCTFSRGRRYSYYITRKRPWNTKEEKPYRVPASDLEKIVQDQVCRFLRDQSALHSELATSEDEIEILARVFDLGRKVAKELASCSRFRASELVHRFVQKIFVHEDAVRIDMNASSLLREVSSGQTARSQGSRFRLPSVRVRRGFEIRLLIEGAGPGYFPQPDLQLIKLLSEARTVREALLTKRPGVTFQELAEQLGFDRQQFRQRLYLGWLSPHIVRVIVDGGNVVRATRSDLLQKVNLPACWYEQEKALGFGLANSSQNHSRE